MLSQQAVTESQKHVSDYRDLYDTLQAEDKVMDRDFKRKFHDIPAYHTDALYKLFRKRPRLERTRKQADVTHCHYVYSLEKNIKYDRNVRRFSKNYN